MISWMNSGVRKPVRDLLNNSIFDAIANMNDGVEDTSKEAVEHGGFPLG